MYVKRFNEAFFGDVQKSGDIYKDTTAICTHLQDIMLERISTQSVVEAVTHTNDL